MPQGKDNRNMCGGLGHYQGAARSLLTAVVLPVIFLSPGRSAFVGQASAAASQLGATTGIAEYHTPLAGEPLHTEFMGEKIDVPAMDRENVMALTLGGTYYTPRQGSIAGSPIGALYLKKTWETSRTRNIISIFVNDLEYEKSFGHLELVTRFENNTIPGGQTETISNREVKQSSVEWGTLAASVGPGLRYKVAPFQADNDLRLQLLGKVGYFYANSTSDTGPDQVLPPDTMLYGAKLRMRYDGMRRNLLELPHSGIAAGFDLDVTHRDKWADFGSSAIVFRKSGTQDFTQFSGYLIGAAGIPGLSEKNRIFMSLHGGTMDTSSVDRFNCFRIGGGPLPGESDDLYRPNYPGTMFNNVLVSSYAMAALEYRRELAFFMYLHLRETFIWADRSTAISENPVKFGFKSDNGYATTVGIDTGFLWNSSLYLDYSWESGFIRDGSSGSGLILTWNKSF